jgi:hypothetical protein
VLAIAGLAAAMAASTAGIAAAAPAGKLDSQVVGNVRIDPEDATVASVNARYVCEGGDGAHVWVSVKQAASRRPEQFLTGEGSSAESAAWSQSHENAVTCDGRWHSDTFTVDQSEQGFGILQPGQAWVQFCVIPPGADPENGGITWSMRFARIA